MLISLHLVFNQAVPTQCGRCPNFCSISSCLKEGYAKLELDGGRLEGGRGVDAHCVSSQVLVCCSRVESTGNLSGEPVDPNLTHEVGEALAGLKLVLAQHVGWQLGGRDQGGDQNQWKQVEEHFWSLL